MSRRSMGLPPAAIYVDFQLRPTNSAQINYYGTVLDWPEGDTAGQVTRHLTTTFKTTENTTLQSTDAVSYTHLTLPTNREV